MITKTEEKKKPPFREDKTTQAAAILLKLRGGRMNYLKLIKLLYIVDRKALLSWGRPVSFDSYVSMDNGPVLSKTYSLICDGFSPEYRKHNSCWEETISIPENHDVKLRKDDFSTDELSEAEINLIENVFQEYGHLNRWKLVDIVHQFPEWKDPHGSAIPIEYSDILKDGNESEISAVEDDLKSLALLDNALS